MKDALIIALVAVAQAAIKDKDSYSKLVSTLKDIAESSKESDVELSRNLSLITKTFEAFDK